MNINRTLSLKKIKYRWNKNHVKEWKDERSKKLKVADIEYNILKKIYIRTLWQWIGRV